jgi:predicted ABC-type sugar transport system permease subunit
MLLLFLYCFRMLKFHFEGEGRLVSVSWSVIFPVPVLVVIRFLITQNFSYKEF